MQHVVQVEQLLPLALHQAGNGDAGPAFDDPGDLLIGDLIPEQGGVLLAFLGKGFFLRQLLLQGRQTAVFQLGGLVEVVFPLSLFVFGYF